MGCPPMDAFIRAVCGNVCEGKVCQNECGRLAVGLSVLICLLEQTLKNEVVCGCPDLPFPWLDIHVLTILLAFEKSMGLSPDFSLKLEQTGL